MKKKFSKILGVGLTLALLCSLLLTAAPVAAISTPTVTLNNYVISHRAKYTIIFWTDKQLVPTDKIVVTFREGTDITAITDTGDADVTIRCSSGIGVGASTATQAASVTDEQELTITVPTMGDTDIGARAIVQLIIGTGAPIVNPDTSGDYTLTVATSAETTAVPSAAYTITTPTLVSPISQPSVVLDTYVISQTAEYTISFRINEWLVPTDKIVVTFREGTDITAITDTGDADVTIRCSSGIGVGASTATQAASVTDEQELTITVPTMGDTDIGARAIVQLIIGTGAPIVNPDTSGDYTLTVATLTSGDVEIEAAVTSQTYTLSGQLPTALIVRIAPDPAELGKTVSFRGRGTDSDGSVDGYNWRSSQDDHLSTSSSFTRDDLSLGTHTIYFRVMDNDSLWSDEANQTVTITTGEMNWPLLIGTVAGAVSAMAAVLAVIMQMRKRRDKADK